MSHRQELVATDGNAANSHQNNRQLSLKKREFYGKRTALLDEHSSSTSSSSTSLPPPPSTSWSHRINEPPSLPANSFRPPMADCHPDPLTFAHHTRALFVVFKNNVFLLRETLSRCNGTPDLNQLLSLVDDVRRAKAELQNLDAQSLAAVARTVERELQWRLRERDNAVRLNGNLPGPFVFPLRPEFANHVPVFPPTQLQHFPPTVSFPE